MGPTLQRRTLLAGALATPMIWRHAEAAEQIVLRTPGGIYDDVMRRAVYDPFTKATGITVVPSGSPMAKLIASYKAGGAEYDVIDSGDNALLTLDRLGALAPIDYKSWKFANLDDLPKELMLPTRAGSYAYGTVIAYNTQSFGTKHPTSWAEFWDVKAFPGARTLPDMASGQAPLEFALLADGVPMDKLYPLDVDRAFKAMDRIRPAVPKFWDTGALSAQLMSDKEVVLGGLWNGRVQALADKGAPLAIEWNQNQILAEAYGIPKSTRNMKGAQLFIDFALQPETGAAYARELHYGPFNQKAYKLLPTEVAGAMPGGPAHRSEGFLIDNVWWEDNRDRINKRWSAWMLG